MNQKDEKQENIRLIHQISAQIIKKCKFDSLQQYKIVSLEDFETYFQTLDDEGDAL